MRRRFSVSLFTMLFFIGFIAVRDVWAAAPTITSLSPTTGAVGASVTITGSNFGSTQGTSTVKFNGTTATATSWSATSIVATVPSGATTGNVVVTVSSVASNGKSFTVVSAPSISSLSITTGAVGATVTLTGTNFGATQGTGTVKFNGTTATVSSWSATSIVVTVPTGATTGNVVVFASGVNSNGKSFTVVSAPSITSLSITSGPVGTAVTLTGTSFGSTQGTGTVKFNGTTATVSSWSATSIAVTVPSGATTGNVVVFASGVNSNGKSFTVLATPSITTLSVTSGTVGTSVTITGTNFGSPQGTSTVKFNGTSATATSWSATSIATTVPTGATTGNVVVTVSGVASNGVNFVVKVLTSIALTPSNPVVTAGNAQQLTATGTYSDLSTQDLTSTSTWTSSVTAVATINSSGLASAIGGGQTNIRASVGAIAGSTLLSVPGFVPTGSLITARNNQTATVLNNGQVLITGGSDSSGNAIASAELFSTATGTFSATGSLNSARLWHSATLLTNGTVLIAGGYFLNGGVVTPIATAEIYNPTTGTFTNSGSLNTLRLYPTATLLANGKVLIAGGTDGQGNAIASAELFDPASGTFTLTGSMNSQRWFQTATLLNNGKVLVTGGVDSSSNVLNSAEVYDPVAGTFVVIASMNATRFTHTATLLNTGQVLVATGYDLNYNTLASAELYDPVAGSFTLTGSLIQGRGSPTATVLNNGQVIFVGGTNQGVNVADAELYDPTAGTFSVTSNPTTARYVQTASLLINGEVLVAGGNSTSGVPLSSAELYQPTTIVPANLVSIAVTPVTPAIPAGTAQSFVATGTFSGNGTEMLQSATWSSSNTAALTTSNDSTDRGTASALTVGSATVTACAGTICGSTTASVVTPNPILLSVAPNSGPFGSAVIISGQGFGAIQGSSTVTVDGIPATVNTWAPTAIGITIPADTSTGNVLVTVGGASSNLIQFTVLPTPFISGITPTSGDPTSPIEISGNNFGDTQGTSTASLNGVALNIVSWSATTITGTVPSSATTGSVVVSVASVPSNPVSFTVLNTPEILALTPPLGPVGTSVLIGGADFGVSQGTSTVTFNGVVATVTGWGPGGVTATVPTGATTGPVVVNVGGTPSNGVIFVAPGSPNISSLSPYAGLAGTVVTITGTNFGSSQGASTVSFNGTLASPTSWQPTQIVVPVPTGATSGNVTVTASGVTGSAVYFAVSGPVISSVSRTTGVSGTNVLIQGSHFGPSQGTSTVTINGTPAIVQRGDDWIDTAIAIIVPSGATTGNLVVTVNGAAANAGTFTVYPTPVITSISAPSGLVGQSLTVTGTNFGSVTGTVGISGGNAVTPTSWNNLQIVFTIPPGTYAPAQDVVYVTTSLGVSEDGGYQPSFVVLPGITGLSPNSGTVGTPIQINGNGFGYSGTVTFNGTTATPTSWTPNQIITNPPVGATSGNVVVTVAGNASAGVNFSVQSGPAITSLSRSDGIVGTSITITGTGFGATQGTSSVTFNGTPTTTNTGWSPTSITVPVPSGATTGPVIVTVASAASNGLTFTLDAQPSISSLSQTSGSVGTSITINGSNFLATQGTSTVAFNGTSATPTSWSPYAITANVPVGTTTGNVVVTVLGQASTGVKFTVTATPTISTLSPTSGPAGTLLTVNGSNFGSSQGVSFVTINGVPTAPASWASGKITVPVPEGTTTGPVLVTVNNGPSNTSTFTVTSGPGITSISPSSGGIGATVTIGGAGFGATQGSSTLKFNGTAAVPSSWSDMSITVPVPSGATTGNIVATVGGTPSNGLSFTVSSGLSVTSVSPTSGNTGTLVTVTGTGFGATQGGSKVTFNGASASITSWNNTSITASVPSAATTGPLVVVVGGGSSDGTYFTVQPLIDSMSPNPVAFSYPVTITGENFGATQGGSLITCNNQVVYVDSWTSTSIMVEGCVAYPGSNSPVSVPVQITVNGVPSSIASLHGIPSPSLSYVSPRGLAAVGTPLLIRGQNLGATQGQSSITFNGATMTPTSWSSTGIVAPVPAGAGGGGFVNVIVGGATASAPGPSVGTLPTPTSLQISPGGVNMLIGDLKQFVVLDNQGLTRYDATWTVDNPSLASIAADSSNLPVMTAIAAGTVTLTATIGSVSAQMPVTISSLTSFPDGTILWSAPTVSGFVPVQLVQAVPTEFGPDVYSIQAGGSTQTLVEAFTADGEEMWQTTLPRSSVSNVPDGSGGVIVTEACDSSNPSGSPMTMIDFDGVSGTTLWQTQITSSQSACPAGPPLTAVRQDGSLVVAGPLQTSPALLFVGGTTLAPTIPSSTLTDQFGNVSSCDCYSPVGPPMVDSDNSVYVEYEVRDIPYPPTSISSALWLLRVAPDGSSSATQLASSNKANLWPGQIIPDGRGGVLATWVIDTISPPAAPFPYQGSYVSMGQVSTYRMPMAPTTIQRGSNSLPTLLPLLVGENGTAFVSYGTNIASFSLASGAANWDYQAASPASLVSYSNGGGLVAKITSGGTDTIVRFDSSGNATADIWSASEVDYASETSRWFGALPASGVADFSAQPVDPTPSLFPAPQQQLSNRALTISVKLNFAPVQNPVNGKTSGDHLTFMPTTPPVACSEVIGLTDCTPFPQNTGFYAWNMEGNAKVSDDASNWTVTQMKGPIHDSGTYLAYGSQVTQANCAVSTTPWLPDGPLQSHIQQPGGQTSIFYLDAPAVFYEVDNKTGCEIGFAPLISFSSWENFEVTFQNKITSYSRTIPFYIHFVVTSGSLDRTHSEAKYGRLR